MGVSNLVFEMLKNTIDNFSTDKKKLSLIELGIQENYGKFNFKYLRDFWNDEFKEYISLDLHDTRGVTKCDLSIYQKNIYNADVITNLGTSEHVEYEEGQYNCWKNIHNWLKIGGIMIHELPEIDGWENHCRYYVNFEFFDNLKNYGYDIIELSKNSYPNGNLIWCVLKKTEDKEFMNIDEFFKFMILDKSVTFDKIANENNPKKLN
jgi:hypothetical protein